MCTTPKLEPGGGGINVARAIKKLGGEAIAVYPSGGYTGKHFNVLLEKEKVPAVIIETKNETRENIIVLDESANQQYRFGMPGTVLYETEWQQCLKVIEELPTAEFIIASGSLPPGVPEDIYARIAIIAKKKNAKLVVDTSGKALVKAAAAGVYMLKPNLGELSALTGLKNIDTGNIEYIAREVIDAGSCNVLVVSMGEAGAVLLTTNEFYQVRPPLVKRKSVVGAGDSMVAGMVWALAQGKELKQVLQYGVACGTAATMNPGTELCRKEDADNIFDQIQISYKG